MMKIEPIFMYRLRLQRYIKRRIASSGYGITWCCNTLDLSHCNPKGLGRLGPIGSGGSRFLVF